MAVNLLESKTLGLDDWLNLTEGPPMYELEAGGLIKVASPTRRHQEINGILFYVLRQYCREHNFGTMVLEVDVALPTGHGSNPTYRSFVRSESRNCFGMTAKCMAHPIWWLRSSHPAQRCVTGTSNSRTIGRRTWNGIG